MNSMLINLTIYDLVMKGKWCVVKPMTSNDILQSNIDYACNQVDCSIIKEGGQCYEPNTLLNHASIAMNLYYQSTTKVDSSCDFKTTGLIVVNDPSKSNLTNKYYTTYISNYLGLVFV